MLYITRESGSNTVSQPVSQKQREYSAMHSSISEQHELQQGHAYKHSVLHLPEIGCSRICIHFGSYFIKPFRRQMKSPTACTNKHKQNCVQTQVQEFYDAGENREYHSHDKVRTRSLESRCSLVSLLQAAY